MEGRIRLHPQQPNELVSSIARTVDQHSLGLCVAASTGARDVRPISPPPGSHQQQRDRRSQHGRRTGKDVGADDAEEDHPEQHRDEQCGGGQTKGLVEAGRLVPPAVQHHERTDDHLQHAGQQRVLDDSDVLHVAQVEVIAGADHGGHSKEPARAVPQDTHELTQQRPITQHDWGLPSSALPPQRCLKPVGPGLVCAP